MTIEKFDKITPKLIEIAVKNRLSLELKRDFNDELDFIIGLRTEAVDYRTLENPTCVYLASYLIIEMPKIIRDDDELNAIADREGYKPRVDEMIDNYNYVATKLMTEATPDYLLDIEDGHVGKLMWCVWGNQTTED